MSENTENVAVEIYYYFNDKNQRLYTSNAIFAESRAQYYRTDEVFVEKV
jgi:hypothetical protein